MRVLIGTPVHESKDYSMDRWLSSISQLDYPFDLLLVDNSYNPEYIDKLHAYCQKHGVTNYQLVHINVDPDAVLDERLAKSRELIRIEVLNKGYDAWFSLECDVIAPPNALTKLVNLIDDYWMVSHTYPSRNNPMDFNVELGIALISRTALEAYSFVNAYGFVNPLQPDCWYGSDVWFIRQIGLNNQGKHINVGGIVKPIYHLAK